MEDFQHSHFLKIVEETLTQQHETFLYLDKKAWQLLSTSSIIIGLFSALNLKTIFDPGSDIDSEILIFLVGAFITYFFSFAVSLDILSPTEFVYPFDITWEKAKEVLNEKDENEYYAWVIASFETAISLNDQILGKKADRVKQSTGLISVTVMLLSAAAIVGALT